MDFSIKTAAPHKLKVGAVVVGVFEDRKLSAAAARLDEASGGALAELVKTGDMKGKKGSSLVAHRLPKVATSRVVLVGLGPQAELGDSAYRAAVQTAYQAVAGTGAQDAALYLLELAVNGRDTAWKALQAAKEILDRDYRFSRFKTQPKTESANLRHIVLGVEDSGKAEAQRGLQAGLAIGHGMSLAKELGNLPGNICTPTYLAEQAQALGKRHGLKVEVLERKDMEKLGMGSLLSVTQGSIQPPKLITLSYQGAGRKQRPVALIGKGITFDTGGISLKPGPEMDEMKFDMCGAASVLGTLEACARLRLPVNVVGVIPSCENMPGGRATRPGDVVTSLSGQTIEILNTDAEGRLILCDALTYARRFDPEAVVDIATLTGACIIALGHVASGLMGNDEPLSAELLAAAETSGDRAWRLPLWEEYQEQLNSNFADMANIGGRPAGTVTAACFLSRFSKGLPWAHLDIAGTAWKSGKEKGATGRPVPLLVHFLIARASRQGGGGARRRE